MTIPELKLSAVGFKEKLPIYTNDIIGNPLYTNSLMQYTDSVRLGNARPNMDIRLSPKLKNSHIQIVLLLFKVLPCFKSLFSPHFEIRISNTSTPTRYLHH